MRLSRRRFAQSVGAAVAKPLCGFMQARDATRRTTPNDAEYMWRRESSSAALMRNSATIWRFRYGAELAKPMFDPLALTDGTVITWNAPTDRPWHHALWFSWKYLNHVNYWEEDRETGRSQGQTSWRNVDALLQPDFSARFTMELSYGEPGRMPALVERRIVDVAAPATDGSYHIDWDMTFTAQEQDVNLDRTPVAGQEGGLPQGGYAGLSVRLARDFREWGAVTTKGLVTKDGIVPFRCERGSHAVDFSGLVSGTEAGIAILDNPANLNSPTPWYLVMVPQQEFSFFEAAVIYDRPYVLKAGQSFTLRYRVVVHRGRWTPEDLQTAQSAFVSERRGMV